MWITKSEYGELVVEISRLEAALKECKETRQRAYGDLITKSMIHSEQKYKIHELEKCISDRDMEIRKLRNEIRDIIENHQTEKHNVMLTVPKIELENEILKKKQSTKKPTKEAEPKLPEDTTIIKITANDKSGNIDISVESHIQNKAFFCGALDYAKDAIINNHCITKTKPE